MISRCFTGLMLVLLPATLFIVACTSSTFQNADNTIVIYVSPQGNDLWSGENSRPNRSGTDGPLRTIAGARNKIRALKQNSAGGLNKAVTVMLDKGIYTQNEALIFTADDSGSAEFPVTYRAKPGTKPVISGGLILSNWTPADFRSTYITGLSDQIWQLQLPPNPLGTSWDFNQLYINNSARPRARTPNYGFFLRSDGPTGSNLNREFYYKDNDIAKWRHMERALFVVYHSWATSLHHVESIDTQANILTFREPARWPMGHWEKQQRYYVENLFEALDHPGEWYLDSDNNTLYYFPQPGEKINATEVTVPLLKTTLFEFKGNPSEKEYVEHLHFRDLIFRHTDADLSEIKNSGQADIHQAALIMARGLRHCSFNNCEISCAGAHALSLIDGSSSNLVQQCHLHTLGGGGVYIGGGWDVGGKGISTSNTVDNCFIHNAGNLFHGAHGVWIGKSSYNRITHNEIKNIDYSGISCGWSWGFQPSSANHNRIEFNHIHHLSNGEGLSDMGGIYTLGVSPGTTLRNNLIHDIYSYKHISHGSGLYPDEGSSCILMEDNVVYRVRNSPLFMHYGANCTVRNNILALGDHGQMRRSREDKRCHYTATGNIIYSDHPQMLDGPWNNGDWLVASNIYWCTNGKPEFAGKSFAEWQAAGNDHGSIVADPLFRNPSHGDFQLKASSPALKIGFRPIDTTRAGLYGDRTWRSLPDRFPDRKLNEIAPP
jgi:hypothetical protein